MFMAILSAPSVVHLHSMIVVCFNNNISVRLIFGTVITISICNFQGLLFQIRSRRHGRREFPKVHTDLGEEGMGSTGLLLRQRGRGHVDAVRRSDGRRMAPVRAHSVATQVINRARTFEYFHDTVIKQLYNNNNNYLHCTVRYYK